MLGASAYGLKVNLNLFTKTALSQLPPQRCQFFVFVDAPRTSNIKFSTAFTLSGRQEDGRVSQEKPRPSIPHENDAIRDDEDDAPENQPHRPLIITDLSYKSALNPDEFSSIDE